MYRRSVLRGGGAVAIAALAGCSAIGGEPSEAEVGGSFGRVRLRPHQLLVEVTEWTMDWVRVEAPDGWTDRFPVGGTGEGTFTRKDEFPEGEYTIEGLASGDLDESPYPIETHTVELTPESAD